MNARRLPSPGRCPGTAPVIAPTCPSRWRALSLVALVAGAGCGAEGTFDIIDLRSSSLGVFVGAAGPGESTRRISFSVGLPPPPPGECHQIPGDLDVTVNGRGPIGEGLTIWHDSGHSFSFGCSESTEYFLEGHVLVPAATAVLTLKLEKDGDEIVVRVTLPPDPPVAVTLGATELGRNLPISVELRTTPNVLSSDATCWNAFVGTRTGDASASLSVLSVAMDDGVRLHLDLPVDAPLLPSGPGTLTISAPSDERCGLPVDVSCLGVADCSIRRDLSRQFGPFAVQLR